MVIGASISPTTPTLADRTVLVIAMLLPTAVTWLYFIALADAPTVLQQSAYAIGKGVQFALPAVWIVLVRRSWPRLIWPGKWDIVAAVAFGLAVAALIVGGFHVVLKPLGLFAEAGEVVRDKVASFGVKTLSGYILLAGFYALVHSLLEEYYWRWFVFGECDRAWRLPVAIAVSSLAFAAHHVLVLGYYFGWANPFTWVASLGVAIGGAAWAWLYRHSGSLAAPWLSHALVDAAIFAVGYNLIHAT